MTDQYDVPAELGPEPEPDYTREAHDLLSMALEKLEKAKPRDFSNVDRRYAIVITEIEKTRALLRDFLLRG